MSLLFEERPSDSPYIESVTAGCTLGAGSTIRPAEVHWHLVLVKQAGNVQALAVGPLSTAGVASWGAGAEILWIKFRLGVFMPHLPTRDLRDAETVLPAAGRRSFWLKGAARKIPDFENVETFVERLAQEEVLVLDPVVQAALHEQARGVPSRTVRHRFLQAAGLSQSYIEQFERAQYAAHLLEQGTPILDTVYEAGYFDQPHLTRALKRFTGRTPGQQLAHPAL